MKKSVSSFRTRQLSLGLKCLCIFFLLNLASPGLLQGQQKADSTLLSIGKKVRYLLYLPKSLKEKNPDPFPLLLFLHGGGETGDNLDNVKKHGPPKMIEAGRDFPFMVLSPQNPYRKKFWDTTVLISLLEEIIRSYPVDTNRVYLAGLSRGGYGAWMLATQYPEQFAALIAICGEAPSNYAIWLGDLPIWVFHGEDDTSIPVSQSDEMVAELRRLGNPVKYTRYPDTGHDSWTKTFDNPEVFEWMLEQDIQTRRK